MRPPMDSLKIYKMTGSGNDFVVVDNRQAAVPEEKIPDLARRVCRRRVSVGADGLMLIEASDTADFKMRIINPDGSEAEMCGNGSRCVFMLAQELGIASGEMSAETTAGIIKGTIRGNRVGVQVPEVRGIRNVSIEGGFGRIDGFFLDTGVPHTVVLVDDIEDQDVVGLGRQIRHHNAFQPEGTNVDFVTRSHESDISIRTYERGVEDETLSCGTGCVAAAMTHSYVSGTNPPIRVKTRSGDTLVVSFNRTGGDFKDVIMDGPVKRVFEGNYLP